MTFYARSWPEQLLEHAGKHRQDSVLGAMIDTLVRHPDLANPTQAVDVLGPMLTALDTHLRLEHGTGYFEATDDQTQVRLVKSCYMVARWLQAGRRYYVADPVTAMALLDTDFSRFPVSELRMPTPCFWLAVPRELGWRITVPITHTDGTLDRFAPLEVFGCLCMEEQDPDGRRWLRVTGAVVPAPDMKTDVLTSGMDFRLELFPGAMAAVSDLKRDLPTQVFSERVPEQTLTDPAAVMVLRQAAKLPIALALYVMSVHPQLVAYRPPQEAPKAPRKGRHKRAWKAWEQGTRSTVTYVGGPGEGHREQREPGSHATHRRPPRPHVRAGHFRHVWLGPRDAVDRRSEVRWIRPTKVGDWGPWLTWQPGEAVTYRKARPAAVAANPKAAELQEGGV